MYLLIGFIACYISWLMERYSVLFLRDNVKHGNSCMFSPVGLSSRLLKSTLTLVIIINLAAACRPVCFASEQNGFSSLLKGRTDTEHFKTCMKQPPGVDSS